MFRRKNRNGGDNEGETPEPDTGAQAREPGAGGKRRGFFFRRREETPEPSPVQEPEETVEPEPPPVVAQAEELAAPEPPSSEAAAGGGGDGFFGRLRSGLARTRSNLGEGFANLLLGERFIDDEVLDDLETALLVADVGVGPTGQIMDSLKDQVTRKELNNTRALFDALRRELTDLLQKNHRPFEVRATDRPFVVLFVGVNGVGKTTTIGKLAKQMSDAGHAVVMAAGDTFRAAAVEQLAGWGERTGVPVISQGQGADSASVIFDALEAARARNVDVVLADTAGRLQTKTNLMEELSKVRRVVSRFDAEAPHEVLLVLDSTTGQNALIQAREFLQSTGVTGLVLTKLDGTAKGGMAFAVAAETQLPIYFAGVGEAVEDLRPFDPAVFVSALLADELDAD